jgi:hypothetical protein
MAAGPGLLPKDVLLILMRRHFRAKRYDAAAQAAAWAAPYFHPRLSCAAVAVKPPSIAQQIVEMTDDELREHIAELNQLAGISDSDEEELAVIEPRTPE